MIKTFILAVITYIATSIDEIPMLFMLYSNSAYRNKAKTITLFYFIGTFLLIFAGLLGALGLLLIPATWMIGFAGVIPLGIGIKTLISGDDDDEKAVKAGNKQSALSLKVLMITLALGIDDLGVYIPLFSTMSVGGTLEMLGIFAIGTSLLCLISYRLIHIDKLQDFIEKKERIITGVIFILIGCFILWDCNTVATILKELELTKN